MTRLPADESSHSLTLERRMTPVSKSARPASDRVKPVDAPADAPARATTFAPGAVGVAMAAPASNKPETIEYWVEPGCVTRVATPRPMVKALPSISPR